MNIAFHAGGEARRNAVRRYGCFWKQLAGRGSYLELTGRARLVVVFGVEVGGP